MNPTNELPTPRTEALAFTVQDDVGTLRAVHLKDARQLERELSAANAAKAAAEAAIAAKDAALSRLVELNEAALSSDDADECAIQFEEQMGVAKAALSPNAGKGWLSPEETGKLRQQSEDRMLEINRLLDERKESVDEHNRLTDERNAWREDAMRLADYSTHTEPCEESADEPCTCGFDAAWQPHNALVAKEGGK